MAGPIQSSGRKGRARRAFNPSSQINVTPLVDVMLVLLVVFMITAPIMTVGVPVNLPKTQAAKMNTNVEPIVITVNAQGQIFLDKSPLQGPDLIHKLQELTFNNHDATIYVRGDKDLAYGKVMETMGLIAQSGFKKISLIAQMPNAAEKTQKIRKPVNQRPVVQKR